MKALFTGDIHLSPRPRDEYRWAIFPWLETQALNRQVDAIFLLGDLTDEKDEHSNLFINRVVDSLRHLASTTGAQVLLLKGNHDYSDPEAPLLRFLGTRGRVAFYTTPTRIEVAGTRVLMVPNTRNWDLGDDELREELTTAEMDFVLLHQTVDGAVSESGAVLSSDFSFDNSKGGTRPFLLQQFLTELDRFSGEVISGDIHVPQRIGPVLYCGAPHPIRFGDSFQPRVLFWTGKELRSISRTTIRKAVVDAASLKEIETAGLSEGDQAKVRYSLSRSEFGTWETVRRSIEALAKKQQWLLSGLELREAGAALDSKKLREAPPTEKVSPQELLTRFCEANSVSPALTKVGKELLS